MTEDTNIFNVILNLIQNLYRSRNKFGMTKKDRFGMAKKSEIGQSLLEVMVGLGVTTLVLTSLVSAVVVSVRNARFAKNQSLATKYAQEGIEKVRIYRDQNSWDNFIAVPGPSGSNCGNETLVGLSVPSPFTTAIDCVEVDGESDRREVTVTVSWTEAGRTHQSQLTTYLTRWE